MYWPEWDAVGIRRGERFLFLSRRAVAFGELAMGSSHAVGIGKSEPARAAVGGIGDVDGAARASALPSAGRWRERWRYDAIRSLAMGP